MDNNDIVIDLILTNKANAGVLARADALGVKSVVFNKDEFTEGKKVDSLLDEHKIDFVILAGFLLLVPSYLIEKYPNRILNIHPALLPKYGGKGMYGMNVHRAVIESEDDHSGISIHYVNNKYDEGQIIFQAFCEIHNDDSPEDLAEKIHKLEYQFFPKVIEETIMSA